MKRHNQSLRLALVLFTLGIGLVGLYGAYHYLLNRRTAQWRHDGLAAARDGKYEQAATLLGRYIQRRPRDVEVLSAYVNCRELAELPNGQHFALTISALKMLISLDPDRVDDRRHLLELYLKLDARPEAIDTAKGILSKHPSDLRALAVETEILQRQHQDREALRVADLWTAASPSDIHAQMSRFALRARLGQSAEAIISDAQKLRDAHPNDAEFELLLGFAYVQTGDEKQAAQWLKSAAAHPDISDDLARTLIAQFDGLGMSQDAQAVLQQRVTKGGGRDLRFSLAQRLWQLGKWEQVALLLADLDPTDPRTDPTLIAFRAMASANLNKTDDLDHCVE
ncbi:MAG: hypothetical protein JO353_05010, partial [Phycisphaerae bacterium]|nr:hypothetical protein [Phycisphaerae bacterium]